MRAGPPGGAAAAPGPRLRDGSAGTRDGGMRGRRDSGTEGHEERRMWGKGYRGNGDVDGKIWQGEERDK